MSINQISDLIYQIFYIIYKISDIYHINIFMSIKISYTLYKISNTLYKISLLTGITSAISDIFMLYKIFYIGYDILFTKEYNSFIQLNKIFHLVDLIKYIRYLYKIYLI